MERDFRRNSSGQDGLSGQVIGAAIEVHKELGPGLLESVYQQCLAYELEERGVQVRAEVALPVRYKGLQFDSAFRIDLMVEEVLVVELKAVDAILPVHRAQLISYLKLSGLGLGLLINFNVPVLSKGVTRVANEL